MIIENLCKSYEKNVVYENFNLEIKEGEITCILGESGSGKTTLLNVIAGLTPYGGKVSAVRPSYVFQTPCLVPNLTVRGNLRLVCKNDGKIDEILKRAEIFEKADAYPVKLSGGQAQRVSLCRAFLFPSDTVLMDEPFSSLDLKLKLSMMELFRSMWKTDRKTVVFVTHDVDEAVWLADRILVLSAGKIIADLNGGERSSYGENNAVRSRLLEVLLS